MSFGILLASTHSTINVPNVQSSILHFQVVYRAGLFRADTPNRLGLYHRLPPSGAFINILINADASIILLVDFGHCLTCLPKLASINDTINHRLYIIQETSTVEKYSSSRHSYSSLACFLQQLSSTVPPTCSPSATYSSPLPAPLALYRSYLHQHRK